MKSRYEKTHVKNIVGETKTIATGEPDVAYKDSPKISLRAIGVYNALFSNHICRKIFNNKLFNSFSKPNFSIHFFNL